VAFAAFALAYEWLLDLVALALLLVELHAFAAFALAYLRPACSLAPFRAAAGTSAIAIAMGFASVASLPLVNFVGMSNAVDLFDLVASARLLVELEVLAAFTLAYRGRFNDDGFGSTLLTDVVVLSVARIVMPFHLSTVANEDAVLIACLVAGLALIKVRVFGSHLAGPFPDIFLGVRGEANPPQSLAFLLVNSFDKILLLLASD